ncbi:hypothetical protein TNCV_699201 [Trichonephila clavipes]|nr:hypothetical protein TNCV_699201 [Trichonephila clavipes]
MEGKSCVWAEDDVVTAVGIFGLCLDDSGASSRLQSVEACQRDAHLEQVSCPNLCISMRAFCMAKGDTFNISLLGSEMIKNLILRESWSTLRERRIPFDFQRTSLEGLALDSATSSGLGRAPRSAMQDPIQAPPGTTRQAGLYTS